MSRLLHFSSLFLLSHECREYVFCGEESVVHHFRFVRKSFTGLMVVTDFRVTTGPGWERVSVTQETIV